MLVMKGWEQAVSELEKVDNRQKTKYRQQPVLMFVMKGWEQAVSEF
jgi:hypothetical protein